jgi:hypothetical protein
MGILKIISIVSQGGPNKADLKLKEEIKKSKQASSILQLAMQIISFIGFIFLMFTDYPSNNSLNPLFVYPFWIYE